MTRLFLLGIDTLKAAASSADTPAIAVALGAETARPLRPESAIALGLDEATPPSPAIDNPTL